MINISLQNIGICFKGIGFQRYVYVALTAALLLLMSSAIANDTVLLTIASSQPKSHYVNKNIKKFTFAVQKATNNRIGFKHVSQSDGYDDARILQEFMDGKLDIISISTDSLLERIPALGILSLLLVFDDKGHIQKSWSTKSELRKHLGNAVSETLKADIVWSQTLFRNIILQSDSFAPFTPDTLKNARVGIYNPVQSEIVEALGAKPIELAESTLKAGYKVGSVDFLYTNLELFDKYELGNFFSKVILSYDSITENLVIMSKNAQAKLSSNDKELLQKVASKAELDARNFAYTQEILFVNRWRDEVSFEKIPKHSIMQWRRKLRPIYANYLQRSGAWAALGFVSINKARLFNR